MFSILGFFYCLVCLIWFDWLTTAVPPNVDDIRLRKRSVTERSAMDISEGIIGIG